MKKQTSSEMTLEDPLRIVGGLASGIVWQRNRENLSDQSIQLEAAAAGEVFVRVANGNSSVFEKNYRVRRGDVSLKIKGVPVGGSYTVDINYQPDGGKTWKKTFESVWVGDVWILGGQSNMQGCGLLTKDFVPHPAIRAFFMDDRWEMAKDPLHNLWQAVDPVHEIINGGPWGRGNPLFGAGPGPTFAQEMFRLTGIPQGLIACAHGGTTMDQWSPKLNGRGGRSLYGAMLRRVRKNGGSVAGLLWYQGESDADPVNAPLYTGKMKAFIQALRRDLKSPRLPVAMVQIGRFTECQASQESTWNMLQHQQAMLPNSIPFLAVVPAVDLSLDDPIHISGKDQNVLGVRLADAMKNLLAGGKSSLPLGIKSIKIQENPDLDGKGAVFLTLENAGAELTADGRRPLGFSVRSPEGKELLYNTSPHKSGVCLLCGVPSAVLLDATLHYGFGADPVCNVRDGHGRSLPVFGPLRLGPRRNLGPYLQQWRLSHLDREFRELNLRHVPTEGEDLGDLQVDGNFSDIRQQVVAKKNGTFLFHAAMEAKTAVRLAAWLGYDGPICVWLGNKLIYKDLDGKTPAWADQGRSQPFQVPSGIHRFTIALGADAGKAWGIYMRLELLGKTPGTHPNWCAVKK
jgi:sialate O-acetylesterase